MRRQLVPAVMSMVVFTVLLGIGYPARRHRRSASWRSRTRPTARSCERNGRTVGSSLIGQAFTDKKGEPHPKYFQSRPSAAVGADGTTEAGYDPTLSSGSNLGPTNPEFLKVVATAGRRRTAS